MNMLNRLTGRGRRSGPRRAQVELHVDQFEDRLLLSTFSVTKTADSGQGSLRQAMLDANGNPGPDTIDFQISQPGSLTISPKSQLPTLTGQTLIDGTTESGIVIDGGGLSQDGFVLGSGSSNRLVQGLTVPNFAGAALNVQSSNDTIRQNTLGTIGLGNHVGVLISGGSNVTVGGPGVGNTIGYNTQQGVLVVSGGQNVASQNLYVGSNGPNSPVQSNDIFLVPRANGNQPSPTLLTAYLSGANLVAEVSGVAAGTTVELYQLDTAAPGQRAFLGSGPATLVNGILAVTIPKGAIQNTDQLVATGTLAANGTSAFSAAQTVADLYTVVNTNPSGAGSLYQAIVNANTHSGPNTITFAITGSLIIQPTAALPLPAITDQVTINGTTQLGVVIDGNALTQDGLVLGAGSGNSVIQGLTIQNFAGAAVNVQSSNDTIRQDTLGTSGLGNHVGVLINGGSNVTVGGAGLGNTIQYNTQQGVLVASGSQNDISQNLYIGSNGPNAPVQSNDIVLVPGGNNNQPSPTLLTTYISNGNLLAEVSGVTAGTNLELYQFTAGQRTYLGTGTVGLVGGILTVSIPKGSIVNTNLIVAAATTAANGTSAFSAAQTVADLYTVINTNSSGVGSLYQAILNADAHTATAPNTITFAITGGSLTIQPTAALPLPAITDQVVIDGVSQPGVVIDGGGLSQDGIVLAPGSDGSTIQGLTIQQFAGSALNVQSSNDAIEQNSLGTSGRGNRVGVLISNGSGVAVGGPGAGNTIGYNTQQGILIVSGSQNVVSQNLFVDSNGPNAPVQSNDIVLVPGANGNQPPPTILTASLSGANLVLTVAGVPVDAAIEVYQITEAPQPQRRTFVGSGPVTLDNGVPTVSIPRGSLTDTNTIVATATVAANGTSAFSKEQTIGDQFVVTTTANSGVGSLFQAIVNANNLPGSNKITFAIPAGSLISTFGKPLPAITDPIVINGVGVSQPVIIDGGGAAQDGFVLAPGSDGSTIEGLAIQKYQGAAIHVFSGGNFIQGTSLGTTGNTNKVGVLIEGGTGNLVGGTAGNTITASTGAGVEVNGGATGTLVESNNIAGGAVGVQINGGATGTLVESNSITGNAVGVQIIDSSGNTVGGAGFGNTIGGNVQQGVYIVSGIQNVVSQNLYQDTNGHASPAGDIVIGSGANNNQPAPHLISLSRPTQTQWSLLYDVSVPNVPPPPTPTPTVSVEFYGIDPTDDQRVYLGSQTVTLGQGPYTATIDVSSHPLVTDIVATATPFVDTTVFNGTSPFSTSVAPVSPTVVTIATDSQPGEDPLPGSLRAAIYYANAHPGSVIQFAIDTFPATIELNSALPALNEPTIIDGTSQSGYDPNTPVPLILIDGTKVNAQDSNPGAQGHPNPNFSGILLGAGSDGSVVKGLDIEFFNSVLGVSAGIEVTSQSNQIYGDWVGVAYLAQFGITYFGWNSTGVWIHGDGAIKNSIGAPGLPGRNVLSGNIGDGIRIDEGGQNQIVNSYIGVDFFGNLITDSDQSLILSNFGDGIRLQGSSNNTIGGTVAGSLNVISDNILPFASLNDPRLQDASGNGIHITAIELDPANPGGPKLPKTSSMNSILNTYIGTDATGTLSSEFTANSGNGIFVEGGDGTSIGGTAAGARTVISGNFGNGIKLSSYPKTDSNPQPIPTTNTSIHNDYIGTDSSGLFSSSSLSNGLNGVLLDGASGTTIGGTLAPDPLGNREGNVISGNLLAGIRLQDKSTGNVIVGNAIGTTQSGNSDVGNGTSGVQLVDSGKNTIGGTANGSGNIITGNNGNGILIAGSFDPITGNLVQGNVIGARTAASQTAGNAFNGIQLVDTTNNTIGGATTIGGTAQGAGNIVTGNGFGSFSRTQLFSTPKTSGPPSTTFKTIITDSFRSIATGTFSSSLGYTAVINQPSISFSNSPSEPFRGPQVVLFTTDATGTGTVPYRLDLSNLLFPNSSKQIDPGSSIQIYSGDFFGTGVSGQQDSLLVTIDGSVTSTNEPIKEALLLRVTQDSSSRLIIDKTSLVSTPLDGAATHAVAGHFIRENRDQFALAVTTGTGPVIEVFNLNNSQIVRIGSITGPANGFKAINSILPADFTTAPGLNGPATEGLDDLAAAVQVADGPNTRYQVNVYRNTGNAQQPFDPTQPQGVTDMGRYGTSPTAIGAGFFANSPLNPTSERDLDLVVVGVPVGQDPSTTAGTAYIFKGDGTGQFAPFENQSAPSSYPLGLNSNAVVVGDFEGIGVQDIAVLNAGSASVPGTVTQLSGVGDGTFRTPTNFDVGPNPSGLVSKSFPGESTPGLAVSNQISPTGILSPIDVRINLRQLSARRSNGIAITGNDAGQNQIQGNSIGIDVNGNRARANAVSGVYIQYSDELSSHPGKRVGNTIGGTAAGTGNLISGNNGQGVYLQGNLGRAKPEQMDLITGNIIGLDASGTTAFDAVGQPLGNVLNGVLIEGLAGMVTGNVISGNGLSGIDMRFVTVNPGGTVIEGNLIGTDSKGTSATEVRKLADQAQPVLLPLGNTLDGILLDHVDNISIGGTVADLANGVVYGTAAYNPDETLKDKRNVISGNLGRGIEVRGVQGNATVMGNVIASNLIGTDNKGLKVTQDDPNLVLGNLADGIFLLNAIRTTISGDATSAPSVISGNRGFGIHAVGDVTTSSWLSISGVFVGTDSTGNTTSYRSSSTGPIVFLGNGSDGIFLDRIKGSTISGSVISGNRSNGIDLLDSDSVSIVRNKIGPGLSGTQVTPGNNASGINVNTSTNVTIGGTVSDGNIISGNQLYGVAISTLSTGTASGDRASGNWVAGNYIGLDAGGRALPNAVSGVLIDNANSNTIGGTTPDARNVISGNQLYGVQLAAGSARNTIAGNLIGTDSEGHVAVRNNSDGVFLSNAPDNTIGGSHAGAGNVISGNAGNGIRIYGASSGSLPGSTGNLVANNIVGLGVNGASVGNLGNGIFLDNAGMLDDPAKSTSPLNTIGSGNVISGNVQAGILVSSTFGTHAAGAKIVGNKIGTDLSGTTQRANGGNGLVLSGASYNVVGGTPGDGNTISGNALSGILVLSPSGPAPADSNTVSWNQIGTTADGMTALGNQADGVQIINGSNNRVGPGNLISGNFASGVEIDQQTLRGASRNTIFGNLIGTAADGSSALASASQQIGVLVSDAEGNTIGKPSGSTIANTNVSATYSNVISGNRLAGVELTGAAKSNVVQANYIGVNKDGLIGNGLGNPIGVFLNRAGGNLIGGSSPGAGNLITQSSIQSGWGGPVYGVEILGPEVQGATGNAVQGNLIGIDANGVPGSSLDPIRPTRTIVGVYVENFPGNLIGGILNVISTGTTAGARNIISGNGTAGVEITGSLYTDNVVTGNYIGSDPTGRLLILAGQQPVSPGDLGNWIRQNNPPNTLVAPSTQNAGVLINHASKNTIGLGDPGSGNLISGNLVGVDIEGAAGDSTKGAANVVQGNFIGTDPRGNNAVPNYEYGVYISGSPANTIQKNVISANGVAGVLIFGGAPQGASAASLGNTIVANMIGTSSAGTLSFPSSPAGSMAEHPVILDPAADPTDLNKAHFLPAYLGFQLHGVVIEGSAGNKIGPGPKDNSKANGNMIGGNVLTGIYLTSHDFFGNTFATPYGNPIRLNTIVRNGMYGAYRFDAPSASNSVVVSGRGKNTISRNPRSIGDFVSGFSNRATVQPNPQSILLPNGFGVPVNPFVPSTRVGSGPRGRKTGRSGKSASVPKVVHKTPKPINNTVTRSASSAVHKAVQPAEAKSATGLTQPRVPALTQPGKKLIQVKHPAMKSGK
jgi:hypothetical protein